MSLIKNVRKRCYMSNDNKNKIKEALNILGIDNLPMYIVLSIDKEIIEM